MSEEKLSIKYWSNDDKPREKLLEKGIGSLSNAELIAILIGSGSKNESAVDLAKNILSSSQNDLNQLGKYSVADLKKHKGVGDAKAVTIIAALELGRRRKIADIVEKQKISGSKDAFEIFKAILGDLPYEEFWILLLNRSNKIIEKIKISQGGISGTVIDTRVIMKYAIEGSASSLILCHNHPSGNISPSENDKQVTDKIKKAADIFDIKILDHIIVTDSNYYSFADEGLII
ncbi:MAG: hypothetical protein A2W98_12375 [Bacteroidetes bacterium GWF2_33_38]|nr:MAG: hypothetical protein A2W98_12375 [Bacteroidetes bacterium GWF2_33_38]OFY92142.1 MAG: hypothetical protein A2236_01695 [Bacteroidetes bacterium RIFOXYA2_FULL_33_7]